MLGCETPSTSVIAGPTFFFPEPAKGWIALHCVGLSEEQKAINSEGEDTGKPVPGNLSSSTIMFPTVSSDRRSIEEGCRSSPSGFCS